MKNYRLQFVNLVTGYTTIQIYSSISEAMEDANNLMETCEVPFRITITTKNNNQ